MRTSTQKF